MIIVHFVKVSEMSAAVVFVLSTSGLVSDVTSLTNNSTTNC